METDLAAIPRELSLEAAVLIFALILTAFFLVVIYNDVTWYLIPNWLNAALLLLYPVFVLVTPHAVNPWHAVGIFFVVFLLGFGIFMMKWMGGGDVKLMAVCGLWCGTMGIVDFLVLTAIFGGLFALMLIIIRPVALFAFSQMSGTPRVPRLLTIGEPVPYGVAISAAMLTVIWIGRVPGIPLH